MIRLKNKPPPPEPKAHPNKHTPRYMFDAYIPNPLSEPTLTEARMAEEAAQAAMQRTLEHIRQMDRRLRDQAMASATLPPRTGWFNA